MDLNLFQEFFNRIKANRLVKYPISTNSQFLVFIIDGLDRYRFSPEDIVFIRNNIICEFNKKLFLKHEKKLMCIPLFKLTQVKMFKVVQLKYNFTVKELIYRNNESIIFSDMVYECFELINILKFTKKDILHIGIRGYNLLYFICKDDSIEYLDKNIMFSSEEILPNNAFSSKFIHMLCQQYSGIVDEISKRCYANWYRCKLLTLMDIKMNKMIYENVNKLLMDKFIVRLVHTNNKLYSKICPKSLTNRNNISKRKIIKKAIRKQLRNKEGKLFIIKIETLIRDKINDIKDTFEYKVKIRPPYYQVEHSIYTLLWKLLNNKLNVEIDAMIKIQSNLIK